MRVHRRTLAVATVLAFALAACGNGDDPAGDDVNGVDDNGEATTDGDDQSLSVWIMQPGSDEVESIVSDSVAAFEEENDGVTVDLQFVPWDAAHDQFVTAIGGGQVPDVAEMGNTWTPEFAELGALAPIQGEIDDDYIDSMIESGLVDGEAYGYPWYAGARSFIYRADVFDELGLEVPTTWDEILEVGEVIEAETDLDPINVAGNYVHMLAPMVWQAGGDLAVEDNGSWSASVDSPEGRAAFETYAEFFERGWSPQGAISWSSVDVREAFANGDSAMMIGGGWDLAAAIGANPDLEADVATAVLPAGPGGSQDTFAGGSHFVQFAESDNLDLGRQFIDFMLQEEQVSAFADAVGFLPGTVSGVEASEARGDELYDTFATQMVDHSRSYPSTGAWGAIEGNQVLVNAIQQVMQGDLTVDEAVAQVDEQMNDAFAG
jgi:N,N'-diacetylchitobiose transport system substrate-binding protein